tara:strand:+ start:4105 stop:5397 length:1293 start_codon:yes stop_codon:yes gene_type:complete
MTAAPVATYFQKREALREYFNQGMRPVDGRKPIPEDIAQQMVRELIDFGVSRDAKIGVYDTFLTLVLTLQENGFTNIVVLENKHHDLTSLQQEYYDIIEKACEKIGVTYYVPPMNNYNRCDMKFNAILANPPYQSSNGGGSQRGSTTNPLWWQITKTSLNLLKKDGILSFITPTNIVNGGDCFTKIFLGGDRKFDLNKVDFTAADSFKVGIPICRWVANNKLTPGNNVIVTDGRILDTSNTLKISSDVIVDGIMNTMFSYGDTLNFNQSNSDDPRQVNKFNFNTEKRYDFQNVEKHLKKNAQPEDWAKLVLTQDETFKYPVNVNGKIKYSRVKWKNTGTWRVFYPQLQNPTQITVDDVAEAAPSTFTMVVDSEQEGNKVKAILDDPCYQWVIEQTRVSGRVTAVISKLPNAPIEEVLTSDQLSYIQSQLS